MKFIAGVSKKLFPNENCSADFKKVFEDLYYIESFDFFLDNRKLPESWSKLNKRRLNPYWCGIDDYIGYLEFTLHFCIKNDVYTFAEFWDYVVRAFYDMEDDAYEDYPIFDIDDRIYLEKLYKAFFDVLTPVFDVYENHVNSSDYDEVGFENQNGVALHSMLEYVRLMGFYRYNFPIYYDVYEMFGRSETRESISFLEVSSVMKGA